VLLLLRTALEISLIHVALAKQCREMLGAKVDLHEPAMFVGTYS
jgi:hypothetical protein